MKVVSSEKHGLLRREFEALNVFKDSKFFVNLLHDKLLTSAEFTVSVSAGSQHQPALRFDNHLAMVMEKGVINLDQYLLEHGTELSMADYLQIIGSAFNIVKEAHQKKLVLLDLKGSNIMLFDAGRGLRVWKGIDLDGSLLVDTALDESSFMATVPFMAPELLAVDKLAGLCANLAMDVWSLGILIFNVLVASQFRTFWTLMGINSDADIKEEIRSGRLTQVRVDEHINRHFPGHVNSAQRHLLTRMLKVDPSARFTIAALDTAAYLTGVASISTSTLYHSQQHIIGELKSLRDLLQSEFASFRASLQTVLEDNSGTDLEDSNTCLESLRSLLVSQAQSAVDLKAAIRSLSNWTSPPGAEVSPVFLSLVTTQLQQLLSAANEQKIDAAKSKELLSHLSDEVSVVQEQVRAIRDDLAALRGTFIQFGECVHKELAENNQKHALVLEGLRSIDQAATSIRQEQAAAREDAEKSLTELEQMKLQLVKFGLGLSEIDSKISRQTELVQTLVQNTHDLPTYMMVVPVLPKGMRKYSPMNLVRNKAKLIFICSYTKQPVVCGEHGDGYTVTTLSELTRKALPLLKVGLLLLQIGLLSTGIPIPLAGLAGTALSQADKLSYLRSAAGLLHDKESLDSMESSLDSMEAMDKVNRMVRAIEASNGNIRSSFEVIAAFLKSEDPFLKFLGMSKEISRSGKVAWVKQDAEIIKKFREDAAF